MFVTVGMIVFSSMASASPAAPPILDLHSHEVRVCVVASDTSAEPDFSADNCQWQRFWEIDPQDRLLWVEMILEVSEQTASSTEPIGLYLGGKASSALWVNDRLLGVNGVPAAGAEDEIPGQMDALFFVPQGALQAGENRLVIQMSAMHSSLRLSHPINGLVLAPYRAASAPFLLFLPAILAFGLLLAGVAYFSVSAWQDYDREGSIILVIASLAAALQLASETVRGISSYPYTYHEMRLILILLCATVLSLTLFAYVLLTLFPARREGRSAAVIAGFLVMAVSAWRVAGFDGKTLAVLCVGAIASAIASIIAWRAGWRRASGIAAVSLALVGIMANVGSRFLDLYLYVALAVLFVWLFVRQAQQVARERADYLRQVSRAQDLVKALKQAQSSPRMIEVSQGKRVSFVDPADIRYFSGAGDYVEVHWGDDLTGLISESLAALENRLPHGFIRTHRSYIVNGTYVSALERDATGTGSILMSDGETVPVSRRIMPEVRRAMQ